MIIQTTPFGEIILQEAEKLLSSQCLEATGNNDGQCIRQLINEYDPASVSPGRTQLPYCAMTQSVILDRAFGVLGMANPGIRARGARDLLYEAKKIGLKVDKSPQPGSVFLSKASSPSGLHAGLVWYVDSDRKVIGTIEGNSTGYLLTDDGCLQKANREGILTKERSISAIPYFIHTEAYFNEPYVAMRELYHTGLADGEYCTVNLQPEDTLDEATVDDHAPGWVIPLAVAAGLFILIKMVKE